MQAQKDSSGFIDSASLYEVVCILGKRRLRDAGVRSWRTAIEVTAALIGEPTQHLRIAPSPAARTGDASGLYGQLTAGLTTAVGRFNAPSNICKEALRKTLSWAGAAHKQVRAAFEATLKDESFPSWMESAMRIGWLEHATRLGSLFDRQFIVPIAKALVLDPSEVERICNLSGNIKVLEGYVRRTPMSDELNNMKNAYVIAALLRGRYHEHVAVDSESQIIPHPMRAVVALRTRKQPVTDADLPNTASYISNLILAGAFSERKHPARIQYWLDNVLDLRKAVGAGKVDLPFKPNHEQAVDHATKVAKALKLRTHSRYWDEAFDVSFAVGLGYLSGWELEGWQDFGVGIASWAASKKMALGVRTGRFIFERESHLRRLCQAGPGRIEATWWTKDYAVNRREAN